MRPDNYLLRHVLRRQFMRDAAFVVLCVMASGVVI